MASPAGLCAAKAGSPRRRQPDTSEARARGRCRYRRTGGVVGPAGLCAATAGSPRSRQPDTSVALRPADGDAAGGPASLSRRVLRLRPALFVLLRARPGAAPVQELADSDSNLLTCRRNDSKLGTANSATFPCCRSHTPSKSRYTWVFLVYTVGLVVLLLSWNGGKYLGT